DYTYTATTSVGGGGPTAQMVSPVPGTALTDVTVTFTWTAVQGALEDWIFVGGSPGAYDVYTASQGTKLAATISHLPGDGGPLYVRLWTRTGATWQVFNDYTYTAVSTTKAAITSPAPGSTLPGAAVTFAWTPGQGAQQYWLFVGSTPGGFDLYTQVQGTNL